MRDGLIATAVVTACLAGCGGGEGNRCGFCGCPGSPCDTDAAEIPYVDARAVDVYGTFGGDATAGDGRVDGFSDAMDASRAE